MLTPNGRFEYNKSLCFSVSDYHPETWNPVWNMKSILLALYCFMLDHKDPPTNGTLKCTVEKRRALAHSSHAFNARDPVYVALFGTENFSSEPRAREVAEGSLRHRGIASGVFRQMTRLWKILMGFVWMILSWVKRPPQQGGKKMKGEEKKEA
eukprot:Blabericola_migrator_1__11203@NODE_657_length_7016_cov_177_727587_g481_i0_p5_GENE_NODE_657_length_7016_cov_177_727587_g481_i0NODE_657_length_7016_cov_177_727587_g481_i0_p5_ORF_typecomplete_len153_score18_64UQ_con/PF00179_26/0_00072_NODE_657_length_7016_cov_177_727587_g481_i0165623